MRIATETVERKIAIGGIGYESIKEIARACDSWVGHVDAMIWGDGKFDFYPGEKDYSEDGWLDFAEKRYRDKVEFVGYQYAGDQVTKRQRYLDIAGKLKCDFLIAVDTEEYLDPQWQDFDGFYSKLIKMSEVLDDRMFFQWVYIPSSKLWAKQGNQFPSNKWLKSGKIHKDPGSMRFCCNSHFKWCAKRTTDEQIYRQEIKPSNGRSDHKTLLFDPVQVIDGVRVRMDRTLRTKEQIKKSTEWAFLNQHAENSREFYTRSDARGVPPPPGFESWEAFAKAPHTFDKKTGRRIEISL